MSDPRTHLSASSRREQQLAVRIARFTLRSLGPKERAQFQNLFAGLVFSERRQGRRRTKKADLLGLMDASIQRNRTTPTAWLREVIALRQHRMNLPSAALSDIAGLQVEVAARQQLLQERRSKVLPKT